MTVFALFLCYVHPSMGTLCFQQIGLPLTHSEHACHAQASGIFGARTYWDGDRLRYTDPRFTSWFECHHKYVEVWQ
jgi:hypothetical protein